MSFSEKLQAWLRRAELLASGAEPLRQQAQEELARGRPWRARELSLQILQTLSDSPIALAIWADAAEAMLLDDEALQALTGLSALLPYRADVWTRLGAVQRRLGGDCAASLERALAAGQPLEAVAEAARLLLEQALDDRRLPRALALAGTLRSASTLTPTLRFRLAETALASGSTAEARQLVAGDVLPELADARGWLTLARLSLDVDEPRALLALKRALILGSAREQQAVSEVLVRPPRRALIREVWPLAEQLGLAEQGEWQVARALTAHEPARALQILEQHTRRVHTPAACAAWLDAALWARDPAALGRALEAHRKYGRDEDAQGSLAPALGLVHALGSSEHERLAALDPVGGAGAAWAHELRTQVYADWLERGTEQGWQLAFEEAEALAQGSLDLEALTGLSSLRLDLQNPLRVVVIGEFNAGKSSLVNALVGEAVLPVGVLPTTATVNRLCWAPERSVRVEYTDKSRPANVLEYRAVREFLERIDPADVSSVSMFAPLEALRELELIDTPGFNADREGHDQVARAAARRAHVLLWVLDATAPLKNTEAGQLSSLRELPLPTCVVLNKADRLNESELGEVLDHVREGLRKLELVPLTGPLALSATRAEQARRGDATPPTQLALDRLTELVETLRARSVELKTRVLAQRMHALLCELERRLGAQESGEGPARRAALQAALERLEATAGAEQARWATGLGRVFAELEREVAPVLRLDEEAGHYLAERTRSVLGGQLLELALSALNGSGAAELVDGELRGRLGALAAGMSLGLGTGAPRANGARLARRAATLTHTETLKVVKEALAAPEAGAQQSRQRSSDSEARRRRLAALIAASAHRMRSS